MLIIVFSQIVPVVFKLEKTTQFIQNTNTWFIQKYPNLNPNKSEKLLGVSQGWLRRRASSSSADRSRNAADSRYPVISCLTAPTSAPDSLWDSLDADPEMDEVDVACNGADDVFNDRSVGAGNIEFVLVIETRN